MIKLMSFIFSFVLAVPAFALGKAHYIVVYNNATDVKLTIEIPDEPQAKALISVSRYEATTQKQLPITAFKTSSFVFIPTANLDTFIGFRADLGQFGFVEIQTPENNKTCGIRSTLTDFSVPETTVMECSYFYSTGPKPAFTGSN